MSQWTFTCSACGKEFPHSSISENLPFAGSYSPHKLGFSSSRLTLDCPHCGKSATYQRHDLRYRPVSAGENEFTKLSRTTFQGTLSPQRYTSSRTLISPSPHKTAKTSGKRRCTLDS